MRIPFLSPHIVATESKPDDLNLLDPDLWAGIPEDVQIELLRQGEERVKGTVSVALAADQRAGTTMGICGAGGVALLTASATLIAGVHPDLRLICAAVVTAFGFLVASVICAFAIAPTDFFVPGFNPTRLIDSDAKQSQLLRPTLINIMATRIVYNQSVIRRTTDRYQLALATAGAGIIAGIGFLIVWAGAGHALSF
jgi:hypothetical protein